MTCTLFNWLWVSNIVIYNLIEANANKSPCPPFIAYGIGVKENKKKTTEVIASDKGDVVKTTQVIVTPGGEFREGSRIVKASRAQGLYFDKSPQRKGRLDQAKNIVDGPNVEMKNFPETRVGYVVETFQRTMANYQNLKVLSNSDAEFQQVFSKISEADWKAIQEVEAVMRILHMYSLDASQQSSAGNISLIPFYRKMLKKATSKTSFKVMSLDKVSKTARIGNWPRTERDVERFTDIGKHCLHRVKLQIDLRLPAPSAQDSIAVLIDPVTKAFASFILGGLHDDTIVELKKAHREAYKVLCGKKTGDDKVEADDMGEEGDEEENNVEEELDEPEEEDSDDELLSTKVVVGPGDSNDAIAESLIAEADKVVDDWLNFPIEYNKYLFDENRKVAMRNSRVDLLEVIANVDSMKFYRTIGAERYPSIVMLAKVHFARFDNAAFQERVFSVADNAMNKRQNRMGFDMLEIRTLLAANKKLIREGKL